MKQINMLPVRDSLKNILICDRFSLEAEIQLKAHKNFQVSTFSDEKLPTANALIIRSKFKVTKELLDRALALEVIVTCTSGYDHIDLEETKKRGLYVMYTPDANVNSTAELTWALILASTRKITQTNKEIKAGNWKNEALFTQELANKTLGVVGLGRIGSRVARIAKAFDMKVVVFDPYQNLEVFNSLGLARSSYEEVLKQSDILTFHVPLTFETENMFGRSQVEYVSPDVIIINASRGGVVNEDDLAEALNNGKVKFAALDVFKKEPLTREAKLLKCTNVLLTPHIGAYTEEAFLKASLEAADRLTDFFINQSTLNTLPLQNDWGSLSFLERN